MRKGFLLFSLAVSAVSAQDAQVGIGVGLEKSLIQFSSSPTTSGATVLSISPVNFTTFSVPVLINGTVKLEPELGFVRFGTTQTVGGQDYSYSNSVLQLGMSLTGGRRADNLLYQFGVKGGMDREASSEEQGTAKRETSQINFFVGPVLGVEYFFQPKFSIGARVGFSYIFVGQPDITDSTSPTTTNEDVSEGIMGNGAKISLQWYY